jgi:hypothetical protein
VTFAFHTTERKGGQKKKKKKKIIYTSTLLPSPLALEEHPHPLFPAATCDGVRE